MRNELSPVAKRRRQIVADIECGICVAVGALWVLNIWLILRMLGVA